jgi:sugar transferase (PEP-CTERM/EpsH1 system associated)
MRILWIKAGGLVPPDSGGKIRSYNILRELARNHSVTFFSFYATHENDGHAALAQIFDESICVPLSLSAEKSARAMSQYISSVLSFQPYSVSKHFRSSVKRKLASLLEQQKFDIIVCDFIFAAPAVPWNFPCAKVLFTHNVEAMIWQRHFQMANNFWWKAVAWREWKTMDRTEKRYLRRADHVLTVSEADRNVFLSTIESEKITAIPTGVDVEYFRPEAAQAECADSLVFTGSMDWLPNEEGIFYFVQEVLPLIRRQRPGISLDIVGRKPSKRLQQLAEREPNVRITGWVDDVRPYLARGAVCIVPLRIGGGTRLKIFEAMAMGKAIVSTTIGAEGLPVQHGENIFLADDSESFSRRVLEVLGDSSLRGQIGRAAHKLVTERHSWTKVASAFGDILEATGRRFAASKRHRQCPV